MFFFCHSVTFLIRPCDSIFMLIYDRNPRGNLRRYRAQFRHLDNQAARV